jgi:hypothetical protein
MPQSPVGWALTFCVPVLAVMVGIVVAGGGSTGPDAQAQAASAICTEAERALERLPQSPGSIAEGLKIEHGILAIFRRELSELQALAPSAGASFRAGLADDRSLLDGLSSMIARPDFVELSLTLPGHPNLVPAWLKKWQAKEQALLADSRVQFRQAGVPACEKSLG